MITYSRSIGFILWVLILVPGYGFAAGNAYRCNGCTSAQYAAAATDPHEPGVRYVYDFVNGNIRKYRVRRESNGNGFTYYADESTVTAAEQAYFDISATAWVSNGSSLKATTHVDVTPIFPGPSVIDSSASAYDVVRTSSMQNNIKDWLEGTSNTIFDQKTLELITQIRQSNAGIVMDSDDRSQLTIIFRFDNKHKLTYVWEKGLRPVMTEAVDGNNNTIPPTLSGLDSRTFTFSGGDGQDMIRFHGYLSALQGIYDNVCGRSEMACSSSAQRMACRAFPSCL